VIDAWFIGIKPNNTDAAKEYFCQLLDLLEKASSDNKTYPGMFLD